MSHRPPSSQALYFVAAMVQQQSHIKPFLFVTATDGVSVCVRVRPMFPVDLGNRREHIISRGAIDRTLLKGQDDINPHFLRISKTTTQPRYTLQQQRFSSSTTASALQTPAFTRPVGWGGGALGFWKYDRRREAPAGAATLLPRQWSPPPPTSQ